MDNQYKKITGYRDLTEYEIALMNQGKALAEKCREYINELEELDLDVDHRWLSIGTTQIQQGFMAIIRSITKPTTF